MSIQATPEQKVNCASCQTPLVALSEDRLLHCPACQAFSQVQADGSVASLPEVVMQPANMNRDGVEQAARAWMAEGFWKAADLAEIAQFSKVEGIAVPFWALKIKTRTYWSGMNKRSRVVGSGDQRRNQTYWEPVSGDFVEDRNWTLYARKDPTEIMGLGAVQQGGGAIQADWGRYLLGFQSGSRSDERRDLLDGAEPFSTAKLPDMQIVPGQVDPASAEREAQAAIEGRCLRKARKLADRVIDCDTALDLKTVTLVYLPLWQIEYAYRGRIYHMLMNGDDGSIISAEHPVGKWDKVVLTGMIMGVVGAGGGLSAWLTDMPSLWIIPYVCIGIVAMHASWTMLFSKG